MSLFSDREILDAIRDAAKEKLRKNGLSRVRVKVTGSANNPKMELDADDEADLGKAKNLLTD
jgi:hypothetical protein